MSAEPKPTHLTVRVPAAMRERVREAAARAELPVSTWLRVAIATALDPPPTNGEHEGSDGAHPPVADRDEVLAMLSQAARAGDVTAMKALVPLVTPPSRKADEPEEPEVDEGRDEEGPGRPPSQFDELAARRHAKR